MIAMNLSSCPYIVVSCGISLKGYARRGVGNSFMTVGRACVVDGCIYTMVGFWGVMGVCSVCCMRGGRLWLGMGGCGGVKL